MYFHVAESILSIFLATVGHGQADNQGDSMTADLDGTQAMGLKTAPAFMYATYYDTLQAGLDAANDLQVYTIPGNVLVTSLLVESDTRVAIKDFGGWTINASHMVGTTEMTWARDTAGDEAYFTFSATETVKFEVDVQAASGGTTKGRKIFITVKPTGTTS